jgi:hypothetical protein
MRLWVERIYIEKTLTQRREGNVILNCRGQKYTEIFWEIVFQAEKKKGKGTKVGILLMDYRNLSSVKEKGSSKRREEIWILL